MQRLDVSGAVRSLYGSLDVKGLSHNFALHQVSYNNNYAMYPHYEPKQNQSTHDKLYTKDAS